MLHLLVLRQYIIPQFTAKAKLRIICAVASQITGHRFARCLVCHFQTRYLYIILICIVIHAPRIRDLRIFIVPFLIEKACLVLSYKLFRRYINAFNQVLDIFCIIIFISPIAVGY